MKELSKNQESLRWILTDNGLDNIEWILGCVLISNPSEEINEIYDDSIFGELPNIKEFSQGKIDYWTSYWECRFILERIYPNTNELIDLDLAYDEGEYEELIGEINEMKTRIDKATSQELYDLLIKVGFKRLTFYQIGDKYYYICAPHYN